MWRPASRPTCRMKFQERWKPCGLTECVIQPSASLPTRVSAISEPPESACPFDSRSALVASQIGHRSEEHTSELQSLAYLVCRLLLEKKKKKKEKEKKNKKKNKKKKKTK